MVRSAGVVVLLLLPCMVHAQPAEESAASETRAAAAASAAHEGKTLFDAGLYDAAIERFEASFALVPSADLEFAIAEAYRAKGDNANAVRAYKRYKALEDNPAASASTDGSTAPTTPDSTSPEFIEPSQVPPTESAPKPTLSPSLVQRPLLSPPGLAEASIMVGVGQQGIGQTAAGSASFSFGAAGAGARVGVSAGELFFDGVFVIFHNDPMNVKVDVPILQHASAGMLFRIADDTGVGGRITGIALGSNYSGFAPSVFFEHKWRASDAGALIIIGAASYLEQDIVSGGGYAHTTRGVAGGGGGGLELQVLPAVAIEAHGTIDAAYFFEDTHVGSRSRQLYTFGADAVIAVSDRLDLVPFFSGVPIGETESFALGLQFTVR